MALAVYEIRPGIRILNLVRILILNLVALRARQALSNFFGQVFISRRLDRIRLSNPDHFIDFVREVSLVELDQVSHRKALNCTSPLPTKPRDAT